MLDLKKGVNVQRGYLFFLQSVSMAIQRGKAACVIGKPPTSSGLEGLFKLNFQEAEVL